MLLLCPAAFGFKQRCQPRRGAVHTWNVPFLCCGPHWCGTKGLGVGEDSAWKTAQLQEIFPFALLRDASLG